MTMPTLTPEQARLAPFGLRELKPTDEQVASVCLSYRHDFGLLDPVEQQRLMMQARAWLQAWGHELAFFADVRNPDATPAQKNLMRAVEAHKAAVLLRDVSGNSDYDSMVMDRARIVREAATAVSDELITRLNNTPPK